MFLLVPAYPGCPGQTAVKWLLLLLVTVVASCISISSSSNKRQALGQYSNWCRTISAAVHMWGTRDFKIRLIYFEARCHTVGPNIVFVIVVAGEFLILLC